jgi:hypothetical protein
MVWSSVYVSVPALPILSMHPSLPALSPSTCRSARFYVRALQLNPSAHHVWGYLRTSLACAGRNDLMPQVDASDLTALGTALPLE